MEWHSIHGPEASRRAWEADRNFRDTMIAIVRGERHSAMRTESLKKFQDIREIHLDRGETTLMMKLMPLLCKESWTAMEMYEAVICEFDVDFLSRTSIRNLLAPASPFLIYLRTLFSEVSRQSRGYCL